ncbi:TIGR03663 family protein [Halostella sp. JP-L12]|uniref:flippase activity-associated protein Agl23 n=1 Tax=Halostella TaxID=1843185 RepID=UPI000EF8095D|nr:MULTISPECIES: flippase activity-associated protein Agl23 [Halostella]NHN49528.1 TIGR03663 family protein [Halostella sp. JP-L12]
MTDDPAGGTADPSPAVRNRPGDRTMQAVVALAVLALAARLVALGSRVAHWDEGRLGYATLRYADSGAWAYDPALHGPFLFHVNEALFGLLGPSDFAARLVVALVGGVLPLAALLFRGRLADDETVALGFFLALNPILLYYSRFARNDVLVAAFMLFALGFLVRAYDLRSPPHLYAGAAALALGLTTKENALLYLLAWAGAALLLVDHRILRATDGEGGDDAGGDKAVSPEDGDAAEPSADGGETATAPADEGRTDWADYLRSAGASHADELRYWTGPVALALVEVVAVLVLFYAPRGDDPGEATLGNALGDPTLLPAVLDAALLGTWERVGFWTSGVQLSHPYVSWLVYYFETLLVAAGPLVALAVVGFLADRYAADGPRDLVALAAYWGGASVVFYPIVSATKAAWTMVHIVVPLAVPAAVGLALVYRWGAEAIADDDPLSAGLTAFLLLVTVVGVAGGGVHYAHVAPQSPDNPMVQYGQPAGEMKGTLADAGAAAEANEGLDVLYYGEFFHVDNESRAVALPVENATGENGFLVEDNSNWYNRLPLPWYFEAHDATAASADNESELARTVEAESPPVIVTRAGNRALVDEVAEGYESRTYELTAPGTEIVIYVDLEAVEGGS